MALPKRVKIVEVGPRDGLQNEKGSGATDAKIELIDRLTEAGLPASKRPLRIAEVGAADGRQRAGDGRHQAQTRRRYPVLVPNLQGLDAAMAAGVEEIAVFAAASEAFSQKNINCSIAEALARFAPVCIGALNAGLRVRGYMSALWDVRSKVT